MLRADCAAAVARAYGISVVEVERSGFSFCGRYFEPLPDIARRIRAAADKSHGQVV